MIKGILQTEDDYIEFRIKIQKKHPLLVISVAALIAVILGITDYVTGNEISFSILYLIPITIAVFIGSRSSGIIISVLSTVIWFAADILTGNRYATILIPVWNSVMRLGYFSLHTLILSKTIDLYQREKQNALKDPMTGMANWRLFSEICRRETQKAERNSGNISLAYIDLDNFKAVNDTHGHKTGDDLLKLFAEEVNRHIRPSDIPARLGGDEFALLLPDTDSRDAKTVIERLRSSFGKIMKTRKFPVSLSIGMVTFHKPALSVDEMMQIADSLMYEVKHAGKNSIKQVNYDPSV